MSSCTCKTCISHRSLLVAPIVTDLETLNVELLCGVIHIFIIIIIIIIIIIVVVVVVIQGEAKKPSR